MLQRLVEINQSLEKKVSAQKARIHILETEVRKTKENVQVMVIVKIIVEIL